ncbi:hypothetical protein [Pengzhenrongella sp.]|uniref:hypothetical protein n=1 Tax=Pengzhenrongella sp. TaxID=2888820 RepID=UPI002F951EF1
MASFVGMAMKTQRRARGTGGGRVGVFVEVEPEAKRTLEQIVAATGAPQWAVVQALLEHVDLDESNRPTWWTGGPTQQEVLDISA